MPETAVSRTAIYNARPALRIAGEPDARAATLLVGMTVDEQEGGQSALELRFSNWVASEGGGAEPGFDASSPWTLGAEVQVGTGDAAAPMEIFRGTISALEIVCTYGQAPELVVLAEDALGAARRARHSRVHADMSPADVVRAVADGLGLEVEVDGLDEPVATWVQLDETDLAFLRRLLGTFNADLQVADGRLQVAPRGDAGRGTVELQLYGQLARVRIAADLADQVSEVTVAGWDPVDGREVSGSASAITRGGPGQGRDGVALVAEALGARSEHLRTPPVASDAEARAVAEAALDRRARRFVTAEGVAEGNPRLRVGTEVRIAGVSPQFDNAYAVTRACHRFDLERGYRTEFSAQCAYLG